MQGGSVDWQEEWRLGRWFGVEISLHWTALLIFPWLILWFHSALSALVGSAAYFVLHLVHEFGHVLMARRRRLYAQSITLTGLHSHTELGTFGTYRDQVFVAWGGVLAQLLLLVLTLLLSPLIYRYVPEWLVWIMLPVVFMFTQWNLFLMVVALLPIGPMDGHRAWGAIPLLRHWWKQRRVRRQKPRALTAEEREALEKRAVAETTEIIDRISRHH